MQDVQPLSSLGCLLSLLLMISPAASSSPASPLEFKPLQDTSSPILGLVGILGGAPFLDTDMTVCVPGTTRRLLYSEQGLGMTET